jgi:hypothetical protein
MNRAAKAACLVAAAIAFAAALAGIGVRATYGARVSGDEPQYLITAMSLGDDGDLDVSDELAGDEWRAFHEIPLDPQTQVLADGREVSPHDPLLPALLSVPVLIGGWWAAKATLAVFAGGLAALLVWIAVRRFDVRPFAAGLVVSIFGASAPFAVYGSQVYPELPAALVVAVAVAILTGPLGRAAVVGAGLCVVALPWLSVKYAPVAAVIAAWVVVRLWRTDRRAEAGYVVIGLALAGLAFAAAHWQWYGGWTAYSTGDHFVDGEFGVVGSEPDPAGRSRRLIGLLVDRNFGIAAWQPAWLLVIPAIAAMVRARPRFWLPLACLAAAGWLNATFIALTMHGWWWPGRQIVVVLPVLVLVIAWWANLARRALVALVTLGSLGLATYAWLVAEGSLGHITWIVDFFETGNPFYRAWRAVLPDYMNVTAVTWVLHGLWVIACIGMAATAKAEPSAFIHRPPQLNADGSTTSGQPVTSISVRIPSS